jgi:hypothetical protein
LTRSRRPPPPPAGVAGRWTIQRATVSGIAFGIGALLLSAFQSERLLHPYALLLALTLASGLSILLITIQDIKTRGRGGRMRAIRIFDVAIALVLALPAGYALWLVWPALGL